MCSSRVDISIKYLNKNVGVLVSSAGLEQRCLKDEKVR